MESKYFGLKPISNSYRTITISILISLTLLAIVSTISFTGILQPDSSALFYYSEFEAFLLKYNKSYSSTQEYHYRYSIFQQNLYKIQSHNSQNLPWKLAINTFADLTWFEFAELQGIRPIQRNSATNVVRLENVTVPDSIDWVEKGVVTRVKNQGECGSCWAFASIGAIESAWAIKSGNLVELSEQQLVDCSSQLGNDGCTGGDTDVALEYVIYNGGISSEKDYPYTGEQSRCKTSAVSAVKISEYVYVETNNELELKKAVAQQPVSVNVESDEAVWQFYSSGIVTKGCHDNLDHSVLAVGYGSEDGVMFWKLKNSFGTEWGDNGFIRILRTDSTASSGMCGVAGYAVYPVV